MSGALHTHPDSRVGQIVLYKLSEHDVKAIIQRRRSAGTGTFSGNDPHEGQEYPALIIADWAQYSPELKAKYDEGNITTGGRPMTWEKYVASATVNLQVFLDGTDTYWATSRSQFSPELHGDWRPLPDGQEPVTLEDEQGVWTPDARGHFIQR